MSDYELLTPKREAPQSKPTVLKSYYENGEHKLVMSEVPDIVAAEGVRRAAMQEVADALSGRLLPGHPAARTVVPGGGESVDEDPYDVKIRQTIFAAARVVRDSGTLKYETIKDRADMAIVFVEYYGLDATGEDFDERYQGKFYDWEEFAKHHADNVYDVPSWIIDGGYFDWDAYSTDLEADYTSIQLRHDSDEIFFRDA